MAIAYKNKNVEKVDKEVAADKEKLNEIRTYLSAREKTGDKEAAELLKKFDGAVADGVNAGKENAIKQIDVGINDLENFIISLPNDLKPDSSLNNTFKGVYHELQQLENKSDLEQSSRLRVRFARRIGAKDISEQEQTFIDEIKQAINDNTIKKVVAWVISTQLLKTYVLEPVAKEGSLRPDKATTIVQGAKTALTNLSDGDLNKLLTEQPPGEATGNPKKAQGGAPGNNQEQNQKQTPNGASGSTQSTEKQKVQSVAGFAEGAAVSKLLEEMSKREQSIYNFIKNDIKTADPQLLQKANVAILQFSAELQAILNKVNLSDKEREQLQKLQEPLNSAVEEKAKELNVGIKTLTVSDEHLKATEEHIKKLMKENEEDYEKVIKQYHNTVIEILADEFKIPKESIDKIIDETLEERILRHTTLGELLRNRSKGESESPKTAEGFDINSGNQNKQ